MIRWWGFLLVGLLVLHTAVAVAAPPVPLMPTEDLCRTETTRMERDYGIPTRLLDAISLVESGRYHRERRAVLAWPWTVMAEGQGRYLDSKEEAIAEVRALQAKGVRNIDVGCMQINLKHHPNAFSSLDEAFEPAANVAYAARFLKGLFEATSDWLKAGSYYHSQTPERAAVYRTRLERTWKGGGDLPNIEMAALPAPVRQPSVTEQLWQREAERRRLAREHQIALQEEAKLIAAAWRQARMVEYQLRRQRMTQGRKIAAASVP